MNLRLVPQKKNWDDRPAAPETIREQFERREQRFMSPYGCLSSASRGREKHESACTVRTAFQRDRDRIVYSDAFRRLKYKTQVFLNPLGDVYRTRLTHTLEVAQIARNIARAMFLNEDLAEAIALGHDLGHTPFGHGGETALKEIYSPDFRHNEQSLRVVDFLEDNGRGLNLTYEVRDGILKHSKGFGKVLPENPEALPITLEGCIVRFADIMAYLNHDLDDAVRSGVVHASQLPAACLAVLGRNHSERATTMIRDLIANSEAMTGEPVIRMSDRVYDAMLVLRQFLYENVYRSARVHNEFVKAKKILSDLYSHFMEDEQALQAELAAMDMDGCNDHRQPRERLVCDLLASMTDRYAMAVYRRIFFPAPVV
ncbi:MAG: deoxyguanosinetriphosphate triphosphohydrolase [Desulfobacterales bacterium]|nr:deoxyguanosinetriphosphate triphosphohydrolase [Desulfobacterales bacterium]